MYHVLFRRKLSELGKTVALNLLHYLFYTIFLFETILY